MPYFGLLIQTAQLHVQNSSLPLAKPVIRPVNKMAIEPFAGHAAAVVDRARLHFELVVIGDDHAAFAGCDQLAGLETERAGGAERADSLAAPLAGMSMRRIFYEGNLVPTAYFLQAIEVGRMSAHVHRDDGFRARRDCSFRQLWINAVSFRINVNQHR